MHCVAYITRGDIFSLQGRKGTNYRLDGKQAIFLKEGGDGHRGLGRGKGKSQDKRDG